MLQFNHKISFIFTVMKALNAMYYMTNYITKYDVSQYQLIITVILMKHVWKKAEKITNFFERNLKFQHQKMKKFVLQIFNHLLTDHEINDFQAISCFLNLFNYYILLTTFWNLNLQHFWNQFKSIIQIKLKVFKEKKRINHNYKSKKSILNHVWLLLLMWFIFLEFQSL